MDKAGFSDNRPETHVSYIITARFADGHIEKNSAIGCLTALINAAYDRGAVGITAVLCRTLPAPTEGLAAPL